MHIQHQEELISAARGEREVDLVLEGAELANVFSGEVYRSDVAVHRGRVVGPDCLSARETMDLAGAILAPGFIDCHVHLESSMVTPAEYARAVVPRGTTSVVADPHEIANVWGLEGLHYLLKSSAKIPLTVYLMLPSCVPATAMETSGASLEAEDLAVLMPHPQVLGLGEVMNYPGVIFRDRNVLQKIALAGDKVVDGHAPELSGRDLAAYISAGIHSDHECTSLEEAREKLRLGMSIFIRQGSAASNLDQLLPLVGPRNASNFLLCSDDRHPQDILDQGNLDSMLRRAVESGVDPLTALQMATINASVHFLIHDRGAIAPGYMADIAILEDLESFRVRGVIKDGTPASRNGKLIVPLRPQMPASPRKMNVAGLSPRSLEIRAQGGLARVMGIVPGQILTRSLQEEVETRDGWVESDIDRDILRMAVVERHRGTGNVGLGLVSGFGLREGALATSVAHDSHNIIVVGVSTEDMFTAADSVRSMGGGLVVVREGRISAALPLPIAGLISDRPMTEVVEAINQVKEAARCLGSTLEDPFMTLSFLALPVVPELKLTDRGLVDVTTFSPVPLFYKDRP